MSDLFKNTDFNFEKVAMVYLDRDVTTWVKSIISTFFSNYPELQNQYAAVEWQKKDATKGYAVGSLKVLKGSVPVIIKDFQLYPLDVIMFGSSTIPLTKDTIQELLSKPNPFQGIAKVEPKSSLDIFGDRLQMSPVDYVGMRSDDPHSTTRNAVKTASFIDNIDTVDKAAVEQIFNYVHSDPVIQANFEKNANVDVLAKIASKQVINANTIIDSYLKDLEIDRQYSYEDENGNTIVKQANSMLDYSWTFDGNGTNMPDKINVQNFRPPVMPSPTIINPQPENLLKTGSYGEFVSGNTSTGQMQILNIEKIEKTAEANLYDMFSSNEQLYVDRNRNFCKVAKSFEKVAHTKLAHMNPKVGDHGVWCINNTVSEPFTIISMQKYAENGMSRCDILADHGLSHKKYYIVPHASEAITEHEYEKNAMYVPLNAQFIKLGKKLSASDISLQKFASVNIDATYKINAVKDLEKISVYLTNRNIDSIEKVGKDFIVPANNYVFANLEKTAGINLEYEKNIVGRDNVGTYYIKGPVLSKYGSLHGNRNLSIHDANWAVIHCSGSKGDLEKIAHLRNNNECVIDNILFNPIDVNIIERQLLEKVASYYEDIMPLQKSLVKVASVLSDKTTVDAVLSLGLMKKFNILEYLNLIPDYERITGELAKLLTMSRLGLTQVPEQAVKTAMDSITTIVYLLKKLQTVINNTNN